MALPKSMRYLAAATACIVVYLMLQLLHTPQTETLAPPSKLPGLKFSNGDREPQLDREDLAPSRCKFLLTVTSIWRACWPSAASAGRQLCPEPAEQCPNQRHHPLPCAQ
jgi:hypothetical protein